MANDSIVDEVRRLREEMRVKVGLEGREQYGAWREGTHDDLVFAVALAYWAARKMYPWEGEEYWRCPVWAEREREFRKGMEERAGRTSLRL